MAIAMHCYSWWCDKSYSLQGRHIPSIWVSICLLRFPFALQSSPHSEYYHATQVQSRLSKHPGASQVPCWIETLNAQSCQKFRNPLKLDLIKHFVPMRGCVPCPPESAKKWEFLYLNKCPSGQSKQVQPKVNPRNHKVRFSLGPS